MMRGLTVLVIAAAAVGIAVAVAVPRASFSAECAATAPSSALGFEDGLSSWEVTAVADHLDAVEATDGVAPPDGGAMLQLGRPRDADGQQPPGPNTVCVTTTPSQPIEGWLRVVSYDAAHEDLGEFDGVTISVTDSTGTEVASAESGPAGQVAGERSDTDWVAFELALGEQAGEAVTVEVTGGGSRDYEYPTVAYVDFAEPHSTGGGGGGAPDGDGGDDASNDDGGEAAADDTEDPPAGDDETADDGDADGEAGAAADESAAAYALPSGIEEACGVAGDRPPTFADIAGSVHEQAITCAAVVWEIAEGYGDGRFGPADSLTRAQLASFVARLVDAADLDGLPATGSDPFDDDDGSVHEAAINRLAAADVLKGFGDGEFGPRRRVTRAQAASYLVRTWQAVAATALPSPTDGFADVSASSPHADTIGRSDAAGFVRGFSASSYGPSQALERRQMASVLMRFASALIVNEDVQPPAG